MEAIDVRIKILINNALFRDSTNKKNLYVTICAYGLKNILVLKKIIFL